MSNTISIAVKPHLEQFLLSGNHTKLIADKLHIANSKKLITRDSSQRMRNIPDGYVEIRISAPSALKKCFVRAGAERAVSKLMDGLFKQIMIDDVKSALVCRQAKEKGLSDFRTNYDVSESAYGVGNMRRALHRGGVFVYQPEGPNLERQISKSLTNSQCQDIYRLYQQGFSYREMAKAYGVSKSLIGKIVKKLSEVCPIRGQFVDREQAA